MSNGGHGRLPRQRSRGYSHLRRRAPHAAVFDAWVEPGEAPLSGLPSALWSSLVSTFNPSSPRPRTYPQPPFLAATGLAVSVFLQGCGLPHLCHAPSPFKPPKARINAHPGGIGRKPAPRSPFRRFLPILPLGNAKGGSVPVLKGHSHEKGRSGGEPRVWSADHSYCRSGLGSSSR
jgi:hypothetical protein